VFVPDLACVGDLEGLVFGSAPVPVCGAERVFAGALDAGVESARLVALLVGGARNDDPPALVEEVLRDFSPHRVVHSEHRAGLPAVLPARQILVPAQLHVWILFIRGHFLPECFFFILTLQI